jgi:hypothetical protein
MPHIGQGFNGTQGVRSACDLVAGPARRLRDKGTSAQRSQLTRYPTTIMATTATTIQKTSHLLPRQSSHHILSGCFWRSRCSNCSGSLGFTSPSLRVCYFTRPTSLHSSALGHRYPKALTVANVGPLIVPFLRVSMRESRVSCVLGCSQPCCRGCRSRSSPSVRYCRHWLPEAAWCGCAVTATGEPSPGNRLFPPRPPPQQRPAG